MKLMAIKVPLPYGFPALPIAPYDDRVSESSNS